MTERVPFKEGLNLPAIENLAAQIKRAWPSFGASAFVHQASEGLDALELKDRVRHVICALQAHLPDYPEALDILLATGAAWVKVVREDGLSNFGVWPLIDFVGEHGVESFDESMVALRALTGLWSAEFAVRPFLIADPERACEHLRSWVKDPDHHVRRLISEGTRPRLPWGQRLPGFIVDPGPVLSLLEMLRDDESEYVRRSVANNLNDISKDHPELVVETCCRWWQEQDSKSRQKLVRHALRTLIKAGNPGALAVLGFDPEAEISVENLRVEKSSIQLGQAQTFAFELVHDGDDEEDLVVDYGIHLVKKAGHRTVKVFKLKTLKMQAGSRITLQKRHAFKQVTVRSYHPGRHAVEVMVNGRSRAQVEFDLEIE